ncbi:MAG: mannosyltransferase family protein [Phycisphaerae bacterium]
MRSPQPFLAESRAAEPALPRGIAVATGIYLLTRLVVWVAAYAGAVVFFRIEEHIEPPFSYRINELQAEFAKPDSALRRRWIELLGNFSPLLWWDSGHYRSILERGYSYSPPTPGEPEESAQHNIAFFPFFPLLCAPLAPLIGARAAMVLVANTCGLVACVLAYAWLRRRLPHGVALLAVAVVCCWPPACFYSFGYSESTALMLTAATLLLIDCGRFWPAALTCGLATAARPTALSLVIALLAAYVWSSRKSGDRERAGEHRTLAGATADDAPAGGRRSPRLGAWSRELPRVVALAIVGASGVIAYAVYLAHRFGSPLVYFANYQAGWNDPSSRAPWNEFLTLQPIWRGLRPLRLVIADLPASLVGLAGPMTWNMPCTLAMVGLSIAGTLRGPTWLRPVAPLGALIFVHHYFSCGGADFSLESAARYTTVALPGLVFLALGLARASAAVRIASIAAMLLLEASWAFQFGMHEWAG